MSLNFNIKKKLGRARIAELQTVNGTIKTPAFAVVGTKAAFKAMTPEQVKNSGGQIALANTYHLYLQPGSEVVAKAGGLGEFMNWQGPTITDSGGFQVFSLGQAFGRRQSKISNASFSNDLSNERKKSLANITEEGVEFKSHIDGSKHFLTPEISMEIQWDLGADIIFAFDECTSPLADHAYQKKAMERTHRWAKRSLQRHNELDKDKKQSIFGVVQGGRFEDLRKKSAEEISKMDVDGESFDGFGIGGSFEKEDIETAVGWVNRILPEEKPRHLLGIGDPTDLFGGVEAGIDLFDCVAPTRIARNGTLYTKDGLINILNTKFKTDSSAIENDCKCATCQNYSKSYLSHLFRAKEMLGATLASIHNIYFINKLMQGIRESIENESFAELKKNFLARYK